MKKDIHTTYHKEVDAVCICGNTFKVNATVVWPIKVEACPACHSTYTGKKEKLVMRWRLEQFEERRKKMEALKSKK